MKIKLTADSTIDLNPTLLEQHEIAISPLSIVMNGQAYRDTIDISPDDIYRQVENGADLPKTSAVNVGEYLTFFEQFSDYDYVVHFSLGSKFSSSFQNATIASTQCENVKVIDTNNLTSGSGLLVLFASEHCHDYESIELLIEALEQVKPKVKASFVVATMEYLRKGGRIGTLTQQGIEALKIHPQISVVDGAMKIGKMYRGTSQKAQIKYIKEILEQKHNYDESRIIITHSGVDADYLQSVVQLVEEANYFKEVLVTRAGCTISTHCGPNTLGLMGIKKS